MQTQTQSISEVTRRNIIDELRLERVKWSGRLDHGAFLSRLFDLDALPSFDPRFRTAARDIQQHTVNNHDWDFDWVYEDSRFTLLRGPDEAFLRFLCEMIHPIVRPDSTESQQLLQIFNKHLAIDGWEIASRGEISGKPIYAARETIEGASFALRQVQAVAQTIGSDYVSQQITRMESAIQHDPELAIGTAKEFLETISKTILTDSGEKVEDSELPALIRLALAKLQFDVQGAPDPARAEKAIGRLLGNLSGVGSAIGEVRNAIGSGHGKAANIDKVTPIHARLVVNAAVALGVFMFEAFAASNPGPRS